MLDEEADADTSYDSCVAGSDPLQIARLFAPRVALTFYLWQPN